MDPQYERTHEPADSADPTASAADRMSARSEPVPDYRRRLVRGGVALAASLLTYGAVAGGLLRFGAPVQVGLLVGVVAGLLAGGIADSAVAGGLAILLGVVLMDAADMTAALPLIWVSLLVSAGVGAGLAWWLRRGPRKLRSWIAVGAIVLIVGNFWFAALTMDLRAEPGQPTALDQLSQVPPAGVVLSDNTFYQRVLWMVDGGQGYYQAFRQAYNENARWGTDPASAISYRFPTLFWFWKLLPGKPLGIVLAMIVLSTIGILSGVWIVREQAHVAFAVPVAAVLAAYFLNPSTTNGMLYQEAWAVPLGLLGVALTVSSYVRRPMRRWLVAGVALAVLATLVRETMGYLIVAGALASLFAPAEERRFRVGAWLAGAAVVGVAFALHVQAVGDAVARDQTVAAWLNGGPASLWAGLTWATTSIAGAWVVPACAALALVGTAMARDRELRAYGLAAVVLALAMITVFGNDAINDFATLSGRVNYWGFISAPVLIAFAGWAPAVALRAGRSQAERTGAP